jgi:Copper transport outer membrane protein, MctB
VDLADWTAFVIDFRYHLVSIIAVFLALAVGLVVGATALSGPAETLLKRVQTELARTNATLIKEKQALNQQVNADQAFGQANAQPVLRGVLAGQKVVLVVAPGADATVASNVTSALGQAGATVTGQVDLSQNFLDTNGRTESVLSELAQRLHTTANVTLPANPASSAVAGQQAAATVLSAAILTKRNGAGAGKVLSAAAVTSIFSGFNQGGFLHVSGPNGGTSMTPATLAVLIVPAGQPVASSASLAAAQVLPVVAQELKTAGDGTVMAGPISAIAPNSAISTENAALQVSTVDYADTEIGAIMVAQALNLLLNGNAPARYGLQSATAPSPAPTPLPSATSATPSPTPKPTVSGSKRGHQ